MLDLPLKGNDKELMRALGVSGKDATMKMSVVFGLVKAARKGNVQAFDKLMQLMGEDVTETQNNGILDDLNRWLGDSNAQ